MFEFALFVVLLVAFWYIFYHVSEAITDVFGTPQTRRQKRLKLEREKNDDNA